MSPLLIIGDPAATKSLQAFGGAQKVDIAHQKLTHGDRCPECRKGNVYRQKEPKVLVRIVGSRELCPQGSAEKSLSGQPRCAQARHRTAGAPRSPATSRTQRDGPTPGRIVNAEQLESLGLLAGRKPERPPTPSANAPQNHGKTGADISRTDFFRCMMAAPRGHEVEEIAAKLMAESSKTRENGEAYARLTAENATAACERGRQRSGIS